ncbi:hypothetical protein [Scytonema millei]
MHYALTKGAIHLIENCYVINPTFGFCNPILREVTSRNSITDRGRSVTN